MLALLKMLLPINSIFQLMLIIIKLQSMSASIWCKDLKGKVLFSLPPLVKEYLFIHSPTTLRDLVKLHSCMLSWITEIVWQPVEQSAMQVNLDSYPIFKEASALLFMTECSSLTMELECHSDSLTKVKTTVLSSTIHIFREFQEEMLPPSMLPTSSVSVTEPQPSEC